MTSWTQRIVNAVRGRGQRRPAMGVVAGPREAETWRSYPADGLTPQRLVSILRSADGGDLHDAMALYEQMEEKDPHLFCVANTRRLAVTGLPWRIVSAREIEPNGGFDGGLADAAADYCRAAVGRIERFEEIIQHLALALGRNFSIAELVWEADERGLHLSDIVPVDFARITTGPLDELRVLTDEAPHEGVPLAPNKFIVHIPHAASAHPMRGGLLRVSALAYLAKNFAIKDWLIFAEIFGMPVRIARYEPSATPEEKSELLDMLRRLGTDAAGIFSKAVELEIKQTRIPGDTNPYESICQFFNRELSKAWLGQTLTTDTARAMANLGAAEVHDRVRRDLRDDDIRKEAATIRRDLLSVLTRFAFGPEAEPPYFRRTAEEPSPDGLAKLLSTAVNHLGLRVPIGWAHAMLGIPEAGAAERTIAGTGNSVPVTKESVPAE